MLRKLAVITGASKGIGKAIVKRLATEGFDIAACARGMGALQNLKDEVEKEVGPSTKVHIKKTDMSKKSEVLDFADFVLALDQEVAILVNNAGVFMPGQVHAEEEGNLEMMINTNLYSAYHLTRRLLPPMMENKSGHVFNMCSTASIMPYVNGGAYCISKFALLGMSKVLREEMKEYAIRVTAILPGATYTASWEGVELPEERFMKASDVADALYAAYQLSGHTALEEMVLRPQLGDL